MASDVFWAAMIAGGTGLASNVPTYLVARFGHNVQLASIAAENQRLLEQHRQDERQQGAAYQRETLIELQDWLAKLARATGAMNHHDEVEFRQTGNWRRKLLSEELNLEFHHAIVNMNRYRVRVLDDEIRQGAERFVALSVAAAVGAAGDEDASSARDTAQSANRAATELVQTLNEQIGERLRTLL